MCVIRLMSISFMRVKRLSAFTCCARAESLLKHTVRSTEIVIETIEAGEALGWSWLFPPYRWHFSARALQDVRAIALDGVCLRTKGAQDHDLGYELAMRVARILMERLQSTRLQLLDLYEAEGR